MYARENDDNYGRPLSTIKKSNDDFGNPFKEESHHLIILETNFIAIPATVLVRIGARKAGQAQFYTLSGEDYLSKEKSIDDINRIPKLRILGQPKSRPARK